MPKKRGKRFLSQDGKEHLEGSGVGVGVADCREAFMRTGVS